MKLFMKLFSLVVLVSLLAFGSANAQDKDKVSLNHKGHVITVAPEALPAHLAHGDTYANEGNTFTITITIIIMPGGSGTVNISDYDTGAPIASFTSTGGSVSVASGANIKIEIVPDIAFTSLNGGVEGPGGSSSGEIDLLNVTADHTIDVTWWGY